MFGLPETLISSDMLEICQAIAQEEFMKGYYLAGGTALSMQINHRKSIDLDFFTPEKINVNILTDYLYHCFPGNQVKILFRKTDQLDVNINGVKTSFIYYPFKLIHSLVDGENIKSDFRRLKMASPQEIALMKAYAIGRRTSFRDYVDIYYLILKNFTTIAIIIRECDQKYILEGERVFSGKLFLQQLNYTEDIDDKAETETFICDKNVNSARIESYLSAAVNQYLREHYAERGNAN